MNIEQLHKANQLKGKIDIIDQLERDSIQYRKERFSGSLPSSATRFLSDKPELMLEVLDFITDKALQTRDQLQRQLNEL